jgi:hypothetical protein
MTFDHTTQSAVSSRWTPRVEATVSILVAIISPTIGAKPAA